MLADFIGALRLIATGDREVWQIAAVSLQVSLSALALTTLFALPIAYGLFASRHRRLVRAATSLIHTATALPTVVVGLTLYFVISASGPLGSLNLLYTRTAMVIGQFILSLPIVATVALAALRQLPVSAHETVRTLGLPRSRGMRLLLRDVRATLGSGLLLAFARIFTELGAAIILGGNIRGATRTLTTVIALEYNRGDNVRAIALGIVLVVIALAVNAVAQSLATGRRR
jgi:tungstate transport system permease protein